MLHDPMSWYTVAFVLFLGLAWHYARKPAVGWLDAKIGLIRAELDRACALRTEAEATLASYKKKYDSAMRDAAEIVRHAKEEAVRLKVQSEIDLKNALARHEHQTAERLRLAETEAVTAVRAAAIDQAMELARKTLSVSADKLADQAIAELPKLAATKARAA